MKQEDSKREPLEKPPDPQKMSKIKSSFPVECGVKWCISAE